MKTVCTVLLLLVHSTNSQTTENSVRPVTDENPTCQLLTADICASVSYDMGFFPNFRGHQTEGEAIGELSDFIPLINSGCSNAILYFLCGYYLPFCYVDSTNQPLYLNPCRNLCEYVRSTCEDDLEASGFSWPSHLNCSLDTFHISPQCFGPIDPSSIILPTITIAPTSVAPTASSTSPPPVTSTPPPTTNTAAQTPGGGALLLQPNILLVTVAAVAVLNMLKGTL